jgi:hypothetical protein
MVKTWKQGGIEDDYVEDLIRQGRITKNSTAKDLKDGWPKMFGEFSSETIRNHLNVLKKAKGLMGELLIIHWVLNKIA